MIHLVSCGAEKLEYPAPARDLYTGPLFTKQLAYALAQGTPVYVLSAEHGLVDLDDVLDPYERTMEDLDPFETWRWSNRVAAALLTRGHRLRGEHYVILASRAYVEPVADRVSSWTAPLAGKGIGERLQWLTRELQAIERRREAGRRVAA